MLRGSTVRGSIGVVLLAIHCAVASASGAEQIAPGRGSFQFSDEKGSPDKPITVWTYAPANVRPGSPVVFVMHGVQRNGQKYRDDWIPHADRRGFLLIVPEFAERHYSTEAYQRGNMVDEKGKPVDPSKWTFAVIEHLFDRVKEMSGNTSSGYYIYGHSAGAQFVHRFVQFMPSARYIRAIAANPGYYTMPDLSTAFPYGLKNTLATEESIAQALSRDFVLMLGERDTDRNDPNLRKTPEADAQGLVRFQRGQNFYKQAKEMAVRLSATFSWKLLTVPNVGHSDKQMSAVAANQIRT
jgi:poly(3-hydroxybutyrate) depolymerase